MELIKKIRKNTIVINFCKNYHYWLYKLIEESDGVVNGDWQLYAKPVLFPPKKQLFEFGKTAEEELMERIEAISVPNGYLLRMGLDDGGVNIYIILPKSAADLKNMENALFLTPTIEKLGTTFPLLEYERRKNRINEKRFIEMADLRKALEEQGMTNEQIKQMMLEQSSERKSTEEKEGGVNV